MLIKSTGYEKLKQSVERDCNDDGCGCFNSKGCDKLNASVDGKHCFHKYCDKFKWVIDRTKHYAEKLALNWEEVLNSWEEQRSYWYMNYYQECNQPEIKGDSVRVFETVEAMLQSIEESEFRCPACGGISTNPYVCNSGLSCNWRVYGLFGDMGKGVFVYCKDKLRGEKIFMPIAWENNKQNLEVATIS